MRKEADDIGPSAELDHWRKRMARFNRFQAILKLIKLKKTKRDVFTFAMGYSYNIRIILKNY